MYDLNVKESARDELTGQANRQVVGRSPRPHTERAQLNRSSGAVVAMHGNVASSGVFRNAGAVGRARTLCDAGIRRAAAPVALLCASATLVALAFITSGSSEPRTLYATTETLLTLFALAAGWLIRRRLRQTRRRSDLLLGGAVLAFGLVHVFACAVPAALNLPSGGFLESTTLTADLFVAVLLAAAAFVSRDPVPPGVRRPGNLLVGIAVAIVALAAVVAVVLTPYLVDGAGSVGSATLDPIAVVFIAISASALLIGAAGFGRDAHARRDHGSWLLAGASVLFAAALLSQLSSLSASDPSSAGEAVRMIAFGLIAGSALRWELQARRLVARAATIAERQRVARDLHDGLAQDLAFIAAHGERIALDVGTEHPVVIAARRALQISRCAIAELSDPGAASAHEALEAIAAELRRRFEIAITLDVELTHELSADVQEQVNRIVREAIANAARHGAAETVAVSLRDEEGHIRLRVQDDGCGIGAVCGSRPKEGFGLRSIRERATGYGGYMKVSQAGTHGTVLDVVLP
jgi:signal transduction histidine kinase